MEEAEAMLTSKSSHRAFAERYQATISPHYMEMMSRMVKTGQYGRINYLLERHKESTLPRGVYFYFMGEYFRQSNGGERLDKAVPAYNLHELSLGLKLEL